MSDKPEALTEGELWSLFRSIMTQGVDIWHDHNGGRHSCYESYSARLDAAAADRQTEFWAARIAPLHAECERLRAFAINIMEAWPDGGIDGADLQDIAVKHGMLSPDIVTAPCSEECNCAGYGLTPAEWASGHACYRKTALLKGAAIDAARKP